MENYRANDGKNTVTGSQLPVSLYRSGDVRELDRRVIEDQGIAGFTLMRRAGRAVFDHVRSISPDLEQLTIVCGTGNNGGDGYVIACLAKQFGIDVRVIQVGDVVQLQGDALSARRHACQDGIEQQGFSPALTVSGGVVVDALLGTGLSGEVRDEVHVAIDWINQLGLPVVAVDVPSGLCSDTGYPLGTAVKAISTVSFIGLKQGLLTGMGPHYSGRVYYNDLAVPECVLAPQPESSHRLTLADELKALLPRSPCAHKGDFGHVLVAGGDLGMAGAPLMAAEAAGRVGAGLVSCATRPEHVAAIVSRRPEIMAQGVVSGQEAELLLTSPCAIVVGPGLGKGPWGEQLLQQICKAKQPMVMDADALNILSVGRVIKQAYRDNWILTPHPGEAARLLECSTVEIQQDRFAAVRALQQRFGGVIILKGAGSLVADATGAIYLCSDGNPGMASGGMGDVLSGVLGALLAQGLSLSEAARLGVCLHARAGDMAAKQGLRGTLATDLLPFLRQLINEGS